MKTLTSIWKVFYAGIKTFINGIIFIGILLTGFIIFLGIPGLAIQSFIDSNYIDSFFYTFATIIFYGIAFMD